ncbi:MAG: TetR family transcriptional regulator [Actinophytocola sp.]|nr:TetR family transcriptional regulator [Actinophytocola sp.]
MGRPKTPLLSLARMASAALDIVDSDGLDGLSMRRLATVLGVQVASLYNHVKNKDQLLHEISNQIMAQVDVTGFHDGDWRTGVATWARSYRAALRAHPNMVPFLATGPARRETSLARADAVHGGLVAAGWPPRQATLIGASTKYLVIGAAMTSFARGFDDDVQVYVDRYPHLGQAHKLRAHADEIDDEAFELALLSFLDGLERQFTEVREAR